MAAREKSFEHRQETVNATFETSRTDSTTVEEKLFGCSVGEDEDGEDEHVVFICGKCKLPVGDSLSWDGSEESQKQIRLKREFVIACSIPCRAQTFHGEDINFTKDSVTALASQRHVCCLYLMCSLLLLLLLLTCW